MPHNSDPRRRDERKTNGISRVVSMQNDDGSFDRDFWRRMEPAKRLELVWDMVQEYQSWLKKDERQSRLQRSICRIERS